jgi:hypothetical protein
MSKRERVEDLGRIAVLSKEILDHPSFEMTDIDDWKRLLTDEERLYVFVNQYNDLYSKVGDIYDIARWGDDPDDN